jgi:hypothetical protein
MTLLVTCAYCGAEYITRPYPEPMIHPEPLCGSATLAMQLKALSDARR